MLRIEQDNHTLVRIVFGAVVTWEHGHHLEAQHLRLRHESRHHAQDAQVVGQADTVAQRVERVTATQGLEGLGHEVDALCHRQQLPDIRL